MKAGLSTMATAKKGVEPVIITGSQEPNPVHMRNRILAIDSQIINLQNERKELMESIKSLGFTVVLPENNANIASSPKNWKKGDVVRCLHDGVSYFNKGSRYIIVDTNVAPVGGTTTIKLRDRDGDFQWCKASDFEWVERKDG